MSRFQFRFAIPEAQQGEREIYEAYVATLKRLTSLRGKDNPDGVRVEEVAATSGSVTGGAIIEAPTYEAALRMMCQETPLLRLVWHVEEHVDPTRMAEILGKGIKLKA